MATTRLMPLHLLAVMLRDISRSVYHKRGRTVKPRHTDPRKSETVQKILLLDKGRQLII